MIHVFASFQSTDLKFIVANQPTANLEEIPPLGAQKCVSLSIKLFTKYNLQTTIDF